MKTAPLKERILAAIIDGVISCIPILGLIYILTKDALPPLKGQSIGRKIMKIKCVTEDGKSLEGQWVPVLVRQIVYWIPFFVFVELYMVWADKEKGLRFGDKWAKTRVIMADDAAPAVEEAPAA